MAFEKSKERKKKYDDIIAKQEKGEQLTPDELKYINEYGSSWRHLGDNIGSFVSNLWDDWTGKTQQESSQNWEKESQESAQSFESEQALLQRESDESINEKNIQLQKETNELNKEIAMQNLQFQKDQQEYNQKLQEKIFEREDNSYARTVTDMLKSGLNPLSMNGQNDSGSVVSQTPLVNDFQSIAPQLQGVQARADTVVRGSPDWNMNGVQNAMNSVGNMFFNSIRGLQEFGDRADRKQANKLALETAQKNAQFIQDMGLSSQNEFDFWKTQQQNAHEKDLNQMNINARSEELSKNLDFQGAQNDLDRALKREDLSQQDRHFAEEQKMKLRELQQKYEDMSQTEKLATQDFLNKIEIQMMKNNLSREQFEKEFDLQLDRFLHDKKLDTSKEVREYIKTAFEAFETVANFSIGKMLRSTSRSYTRSDVNMNSTVNSTSNVTGDFTHRKSKSRD